MSALSQGNVTEGDAPPAPCRLSANQQHTNIAPAGGQRVG